MDLIPSFELSDEIANLLKQLEQKKRQAKRGANVSWIFLAKRSIFQCGPSSRLSTAAEETKAGKRDEPGLQQSAAASVWLSESVESK
jgi:hypothetical protein